MARVNFQIAFGAIWTYTKINLITSKLDSCSADGFEEGFKEVRPELDVKDGDEDHSRHLASVFENSNSMRSVFFFPDETGLERFHCNQSHITTFLSKFLLYYSCVFFLTFYLF